LVQQSSRSAGRCDPQISEIRREFWAVPVPKLIFARVLFRAPIFREHPSLRAPRRPLRQVLVVLAPTDAGVPAVRSLGRRLRRLGIALWAASECHGEVRGERRECLFPNLLLIEAAHRHWDAVVVAGGRGARRVAEDLFARQVVGRIAADGAPIAAIGSGCALLERAGLSGCLSNDAGAIARWLGIRLGIPEVTGRAKGWQTSRPRTA
jgi:hypothetical protein